MKNSFGGIQIRNINDINISFICELCKLLQLYPTQILCCGTRLCRWCSKEGLANSEPFICPFCQTKQPKKQAQADRAVEQELNMIEKIGCYSCSWDGSYKEYQKHLQQHHEHLKCSDCHARFYAKNSYEEHRQEICEHRCIPCGLPGCLELVRPSEMHGHYLSATHQETLVKYFIEYFTRLNSEHDQMISNWQPTIFNPNNIRLLNMDSTTIFPFRINTEEIHSSFSMSSPLFKTSPYGYSFILRVCSTNGYLSIYLTLLRTDFDQILTYPFPYNISLCLYDQSGQGKHITSIIEPARNSSSFTRPTSEKNNEVGITQFYRLNSLTDVPSIHLKDGGFFIHIFFDFMNTGTIPI